jgi:hypothetical protein
LIPNVSITQHPEDPLQQVVTFSPPVVSWAFHQGHTLEELWKELIQGSSALAMDHLEDAFDEAMQQKMRVRITSILLYWRSQGWLTFDSSTSAETSTGL